jgi:hypothetical protein
MIITIFINNNNAVISNYKNNAQLEDLILLPHVSSKTFVSPGPVNVTTLNYTIPCQYKVQLM